MEYTGERYLPSEKNVQASYEHYHRYAFALPFAKGKLVLDLASGEGYGANLLASVASEVVGVDIATDAVLHASGQYIRSNLEFLQGSIHDIQIRGRKFDLITCFEAIEHVKNQEKVLDNAARLLSDDGFFIISTPNKLVFTDEAGKPWPWHVKEFYYSEFQEFLHKKFKHVLFLGQKILNGSAIWTLDTEAKELLTDEIFVQKLEKEIVLVDRDKYKPAFFVAIASQKNLDKLASKLGSSYFVDTSLSLLNEKNAWIERFRGDVETLDEMVREKDNDLENLSRLVSEKDDELKNLSRLVSEKDDELKNLSGLVSKKDDELKNLSSLVSEKNNDLENLSRLVNEKNENLAEMGNNLSSIQGKNNSLIEQLQTMGTQLSDLNSQNSGLNVYIQQKEQDIRIAVSALEEIHRSLGWFIIQRYREIMYRIAPTGSIQRKIYNFMLNKGQNPRNAQVSTSEVEGETSSERTSEILPEKTSDFAVCTIASKNYLSAVRVFAHSVRESNPGIPVYVLLVDKVDGAFDPTAEPFQIITLDELPNIPNLPLFQYKYTPIELNTAAKPYFLEYLFEKFDLQRVCYFDPDIYVFHSLQGMFDLLNGFSLVLTPHITHPYLDDRTPSELEINLAGIFNLGFVGVSKTDVGNSFLQWWKERLYDYCFMAPEQGMHVDQNWVNFAPVMHENVFILRDPAYNIAYWNLHYRGNRLRFLGNYRLLIDERPVVFFHFSGLPLENLNKISYHQNRFTLEDFPNIKPLFKWYAELLKDNGYEETHKWSYAYNCFDNGVKIPVFARSLYNQLEEKEKLSFGNPFITSDKTSFYSWLNQPADDSMVEPRITRLHMEIHRVRLDLQSAFPEPFGKNRADFWNWLHAEAVDHQNLPSAFVPTIKEDFTQSQVPLRKMRGLVRKLALYARNKLKEPLKRFFSTNSQMLSFLKSIDRHYFGLSTHSNGNNLLASKTAQPKSHYPLGVNVAGYIQGEFGVAEVARATIRALQSSEIPYVINNLKASVHRYQDNMFDTFSQENPYAVNLVHVNADQVHEFTRQKGLDYFQGRFNIGYWFWELSRFPKIWRSSFDYFQEIWVASTFCQESIASISPVPVVKMTFPVFIDENPAKPNRALFGLPEDKFIFGFIFDYLSVTKRKNPVGLIKAFQTAFEKQKDTLLVIKTINSEYAPEAAALLKIAAEGYNVHFINGHLTRENMMALMSSFDSFVSLHRSEGFGIGLAQAMYLGKPVIATGYSGNMDFMNHNNSFLVRYKLVELEKDYGPYEKGIEWAEPDIEHAAELMRLVFEDRSFSQKVAQCAEADIKTKMTFAAAGKQMKDRLHLIA